MQYFVPPLFVRRNRDLIGFGTNICGISFSTLASYLDQSRVFTDSDDFHIAALSFMFLDDGIKLNFIHNLESGALCSDDLQKKLRHRIRPTLYCCSPDLVVRSTFSISQLKIL
jgi:hypothetical protein